MQPTISSVPAPGGQPSQPGPTIVPPKLVHPPRPKRTGMWVTIVLVVLVAGAAYWYKTQSDAKVAAKGSIASVSTMVLGLGDVTATIRVNGTIAAQNFAALLAPRILGSRGNFNRGGDTGGGGGGDRGGGGGMGGPGGGGPGGPG